MTTDLLDRAFEIARTLPSGVQDDVARILLAYAGRTSEDHLTAELSPEDEAAALRSREASERGDFASDEELRALRAKHGL